MLTLQDLYDFVQDNKELIANLSPAQRKNFDATYHDIESKLAKRENLEKYLENPLPIKEVNSTYRSLEFLENKISDAFIKLKTILGRENDQPVKDEAMRIAAAISRQGVMNIRPVKGRPYSKPAPLYP